MNARSKALAAAIILCLGLAIRAQAEEAAAPMDHAAMAASYQKEAADAQQKAASHKAMIQKYKNLPLPKGSSVTPGGMIDHCQKLVDSYTQAANQATDLAKMHQQAAAAQ